MDGIVVMESALKAVSEKLRSAGFDVPEDLERVCVEPLGTAYRIPGDLVSIMRVLDAAPDRPRGDIDLHAAILDILRDEPEGGILLAAAIRDQLVAEGAPPGPAREMAESHLDAIADRIVLAMRRATEGAA